MNFGISLSGLTFLPGTSVSAMPAWMDRVSATLMALLELEALARSERSVATCCRYMDNRVNNVRLCYQSCGHTSQECETIV